MNDKTKQPATDVLRGTAAGGHAVIINVPGCPLMVRAVDYNTLRAEKDRLTACLEKANASAEHFEREWYLRGDELENLRAQLAEAQKERDKAIDLLETMFSSYENGTACYEDPEDCSGFVGYAFKMDDLDFNACCDLLNRTRPRTAIDAAKGRS